jgi:hypothetical protein
MAAIGPSWVGVFGAALLNDDPLTGLKECSTN